MNKHFILNVIFIFIFHCLAFSQGTTYFGPYESSSPIEWDNINNRTIRNLEITNSLGHCIKLVNCSNIIIKNCKLGPSLNEGVYLYGCTNITISNCSMDSTDSGVVADACTGIKVINNDVKNVQGPMPRGQMVQFGNVYGTDNSISYNVVDNIPGQSFPEDAISLYMSNGTSEDPIQVVGNWIRGGGPSTSGGGIMTGDQGGSYILVQDNILVNPGQYGITISSGNNIIIKNNKIFSCQLPFSNIGLSAYKQYPINTFSNTIMNNEVNFTNKDGVTNCLWDAGNSGVIIGWDTNFHNSNLTASVLPVIILGKNKGLTSQIIPLSSIDRYKIFPNPVSGFLTIEKKGLPTNDKAVIYNLKGQKVIEKILVESKTEIDTGILPAGVYFVNILSLDKLIETHKIIVGEN